MFSKTLTQAPDIVVLDPNATISIAGAGADMPAAAVVVADRGPVGVPFRVTGKNWKSICGTPLHPTIGDNREFEGLRHVGDAIAGVSYMDLVRVVPSDAAYPYLSFMIDGDGGNDEPVQTANVAYGSNPTVPAGSWLTIWPINGDPSEYIKLVVTVEDAATKAITLTFFDTSSGSDVQLGSVIEASLDITAKNDMGESIYLPTYLEDKGLEYRCEVDSTADLTNVGLLEETFTGGTNGTLSSLTAQDYIDAWGLLDNPNLGWKQGIAAGIYDASVLSAADAICNNRLAAFYHDAPPWMTGLQAIEWMKTNCPYGYQGRAGHYPYYANDPYYGGKAIWGISGRMAALKAACIGRGTLHAAVSGHHFAPAGSTWGRIGRGGVEPIHAKDFGTPAEHVKVRLNMVSQGVYVNDCLATWLPQDDLRWETTSSVLNAMAIELAAALESVKFSPASSTEETLQSLGDEITSRYFQAGALVQPNSIDAPYVVEVEQVESDLWSVSIALKVGGVTRRIVLQFSQIS